MVRIFISYRHVNSEWVYVDKSIQRTGPNKHTPLIGQLQKALDEDVEFWFDREGLNVGRFDKVIKEAIDGSSIALLLVSEEFTWKNDYIMTTELPYIVERYEAGLLGVYPVCISNVSKPGLKALEGALPREIFEKLAQQISLEDIYYKVSPKLNQGSGIDEAGNHREDFERQDGKYLFDQQRLRIINELSQMIGTYAEEEGLYNQIISGNLVEDLCCRYLDTYENGRWRSKVIHRLEELRDDREFRQLMEGQPTPQELREFLKRSVRERNRIEVESELEMLHNRAYNALDDEHIIHYIHFLTDFPDSKKYDSVKERLKKIIKEQVPQLVAGNDMYLLEQFLTTIHPMKEDFAKEINKVSRKLAELKQKEEQLDNLMFRKAKKSGSIEAYRDYISKGYKLHIEEVNCKVDELVARQMKRRKLIVGVSLLTLLLVVGIWELYTYQRSKITVNLLLGNYPACTENFNETFLVYNIYGGGGYANWLGAYPDGSSWGDVISSKDTPWFDERIETANTSFQKSLYKTVFEEKRNPIAMYNWVIMNYSRNTENKEYTYWMKEVGKMNFPLAITELVLSQYAYNDDYSEVDKVLKMLDKASKLGDGKASYICGRLCQKYKNDEDKARAYWLASTQQGFIYGIREYLNNTKNFASVYCILKDIVDGNKHLLRKSDENIFVILSQLAMMQKDSLAAFQYAYKYESKRNEPKFSFSTDRLRLAWMYYRGIGTQPDRQKTIEVLKSNYKTDLNNEDLNYLLGFCYLEQQETDSAYVHFVQVADKIGEYTSDKKKVCGYMAGRIGLEYAKDEQIVKNALIYMKNAAEANYLPAKFYMACLYAEGKYGLRRDVDYALKEFEEIGMLQKNGDYRMYALYNAGMIYAYGAFGCSKDLKRGKELLVEARRPVGGKGLKLANEALKELQ